MITRIGAITLALLLLASPAATTDWSEVDEARWLQMLDEAQESLASARKRVEDAEVAYLKWRQRHRPRGAKKGDLLDEIEESKATLADAEESWPELLEKARQAGAPPGLLRRYEEPE